MRSAAAATASPDDTPAAPAGPACATPRGTGCRRATQRADHRSAPVGCPESGSSRASPTPARCRFALVVAPAGYGKTTALDEIEPVGRDVGAPDRTPARAPPGGRAPVARPRHDAWRGGDRARRARPSLQRRGPSRAAHRGPAGGPLSGRAVARGPAGRGASAGAVRGRRPPGGGLPARRGAGRASRGAPDVPDADVRARQPLRPPGATPCWRGPARAPR
jgi:hypothetical protein